MNDIIAYIVVVVCMVPLYLFRKKISFLFCPNDVIGKYIKRKYFAFYSLIPSFVIVAYVTARLRLLVEQSELLHSYENYVLIIALILLFSLLYLFGVVTDWFLYHSNDRYKNWRNNESNK
ncbi:hypothetical protein [Plebeiibacterium sediminum]|uniref:Uncharacterized protein n=1 Tax=Plebeiibacterium sediminum TaxID=2992112 RepID=A0AAE3M6R5_9BACT|nr:hypothetical protein [Plebeiobacterium sediminum]MCW3788138.1 hypothetical protein [Plebeiobacterium sediminum]